MTSVGGVADSGLADRLTVASGEKNEATPQALATPTDFLSWSRYTTVTNCLRSYRLKYIDQVPQRPQGAQLGGKTVHQLIEDYERDGVRQESVASYIDVDWPLRWVQVIDEAGGTEAIRWSGRQTKEYPNGEDADWWLKQGPRMLDNYFWLREQDEAIGRRLMQGPNGPVIEARVLMEFGGAAYGGKQTQDSGGVPESPSVVPAPDGSGGVQVGPAALKGSSREPAPPILWQGYLDRMMVDDEGPLVDDLKCGRQTQAYSVFQLADYALAWTRTTGEIVTRGRVVNLRQRKVPEILDLTKAIETTEARYRDLAQTIEIHRESGVWPALPSALCKSCGVKAACDIGSVLYPEDA